MKEQWPRSWRALKRKCQEVGIVTIGVGRTRPVLMEELKRVLRQRMEAAEDEEGGETIVEERED